MPKFISELDLTDPADREEMNRHVFGTNYRKDKNGKPIENDRGGPSQRVEGVHRDTIEQHYFFIGKTEGPEAEVRARAKDKAEISDALLERATVAKAEREAKLRALNIKPGRENVEAF